MIINFTNIKSRYFDKWANSAVCPELSDIFRRRCEMPAAWAELFGVPFEILQPSQDYDIEKCSNRHNASLGKPTKIIVVPVKLAAVIEIEGKRPIWLRCSEIRSRCHVAMLKQLYLCKS